MMGRQAVDQSQLFYLFNLEEHIPTDHLLRRINPIVTRVLADLREKLAPFYSDIGRQVFEAVVRACMDAGLVKGEGFAVDASVMEADASRYHGKAPGEIDWSAPERQTRAVAEFLTALDDEDAEADRKPPKVISPVDPCSAWTAKANKRVQFGYGLNYLIDIK